MTAKTKAVVEGLSSSGDQYQEAIDCLKKRFDRPRLIHQAHVSAIMEAPALKHGNGRELRKLHDTVNQHLRALKSMDCEPSGKFITSVLELKLDSKTTFELQRNSQDSMQVPHYSELLDFLNLRAQAAESTYTDDPETRLSDGNPWSKRQIHVCILLSRLWCKKPAQWSGKHPVYACQKFEGMTQEQMMISLKSNGLCMNCLRPGHFVRQCTSTQKCRKCQKPHQTLVHREEKKEQDQSMNQNPTVPSHPITSSVSQAKVNVQILLMTRRVKVVAHDGSSTQARALLDSASSTCFVSERLAQLLRLPRSRCHAHILGIGNLHCNPSSQSMTKLSITSMWSSEESFEVEAVVLPKFTCDLPVSPVSLDRRWDYIRNLHLADPDFAMPGKIDLLLGIEVFTSVMRHGRWFHDERSPVALETSFGWVIAGAVQSGQPQSIVSHHACTLLSDGLIRKFWEIEEAQPQHVLTPEVKSVVEYFNETHHQNSDGRFIVSLPKKPDAKALGESRSTAVTRFLSLERSLHSKVQFGKLTEVMAEYFQMDHAEPVPLKDLERSCEEVFYLPMQVVVKESSTTTKLRAVFDASAKSATGVSQRSVDDWANSSL